MEEFAFDAISRVIRRRDSLRRAGLAPVAVIVSQRRLDELVSGLLPVRLPPSATPTLAGLPFRVHADLSDDEIRLEVQA